MDDTQFPHPLPAADWDESLAGVIEDMDGRPLNVHALLAHHPALLRAWWDLRNYSVAGGDLGRRNTELVILRVALHMQCWYEWGSHVERGLDAGLTVDEIERVGSGAMDDWPPAEAALLAAVDDLASGLAISPDTLARLDEHFSTRQVMDLILVYGVYVTLGSMLNTWPIELDRHVRDKLPEGQTEAGFRALRPRASSVENA